MLIINNILTYNDVIDYFIQRICLLCNNVVDDSSIELIIPDAFKTQQIHELSGQFNIITYTGANNKKIYELRTWSIDAKQIGLDNDIYNVQKCTSDTVNQCIRSILSYNNVESNESLIYASDMYKLIQLLSHITQDNITIYVSTYNNQCYYAFNSNLSTTNYNISNTIDFNNDNSISTYYQSLINDSILNNGSISVLSCDITTSGGHEWPNK